jgi:hypothetical protein
VCSAGSNDHATLQHNKTITQPCMQQNNHKITHSCNTTIMQPSTQQSRNLSTQQSRNNNANFQRNNHATIQVCRASLLVKSAKQVCRASLLGKSAGQVCRASLTPPHAVHNLNFICQIDKFLLQVTQYFYFLFRAQCHHMQFNTTT